MNAANVQQLGGSIRVGINTNALTMGGSMTAKPSFQPRSSDAASGPVTDEQNLDSDPAANRTSGATGKAATGKPASGDAGATGSSNGTAAGSGKTGPSAQTRNAQASPSQGTARSRTRASAAPGSPATPTTQDTADDAGTDFGSVLATALGGSGAGAPDPATPTPTASGSGDATSTANAAQPTTAPTDAVAWIAQLMMTPGAARTATTPTNATADTAAGGSVASAAGAATGGSVASAAGAATGGAPTAATVAGQNAAAAGQSAVNVAGASRSGVATDPLPQTTAQNSAPTVQSSDSQAAASPAATGAANLNALADVQKLISGLTGSGADADTDTDADADDGTVTGTPSTHATTAGADSTDAAQAAAALQSSSLTRAGASLGTTTLSIQAAVGSAGFADEVSSRVTSLAQSGITQAQLQLNPADLGPVQVHITLQSGQASVWFGASHADTRAALEQSLPRLREMFAGAGLPLTDSGVFREPPQQQQAQSLPASSNSRTTTSATPATTSVTQVSNIRLSLLDTYA
jgi:flagellar hook-length control protein FliK